MGATLRRRRGLARSAILGRRRLAAQAPDQIQWRAADLCRPALCGLSEKAARARSLQGQERGAIHRGEPNAARVEIRAVRQSLYFGNPDHPGLVLAEIR